VIAGGFALGLMASRFLKASSSSRYEQRRQSYGELPARTYDTPSTTADIRTEPLTTGPAVPPATGSSRFEGSR
jgi:hypothetical protein